MDEGVEKIYEISGNRHRYQYRVVAFTFLLWVTNDIISISLPFLEEMPIVQYRAKNGSLINETLTNKICSNDPNYTIIKASGYSWVSEYKIQCDKFQISLIGTLSFLGILIGGLSFKYITDNIGRRTSIYIFTFIFGVVLLIFLIPFPNFNYMFVFLVIIQFCNCISGLGGYVFTLENLKQEFRSRCGALINCAFSVCAIIFILMFKYLNSWKIPFIVSAGLCFLTAIFYFFFTFESARIHILRNDIQAFLESMKKIAKINNRVHIYNEYIGDESLDGEHVNIKNENLIKKKEHFNKEQIKETIRELYEQKKVNEANEKSASGFRVFYMIFKYKSVRWNFIIMCISWFGVSGNYYGLSLNLKNLPGDIYTNGIIMYCLDSVAYIASSFLINIRFLGRKKTMLMFYFGATLVNLLIFIIKIQGTALIVLTMFARFFISANYNIIYTYSTEAYPTVVRSFGISWNSIFARVGAMIFPFLIEYELEYVNLFFGILNGVIFILNLFVEETLGKPLRDVIEEEEILNQTVFKNEEDDNE